MARGALYRSATLLLLLSLVELSSSQPAIGMPPASACRPDEFEFSLPDRRLCHSLTPYLPFAAALTWCREAGGRLATVYSERHNAFLTRLLTGPAFIGAVARQRLVRHPRRPAAGPGQVWAWLSGETPGYTNFLPVETRGHLAQPDGAGFEGCVEILRHPVVEVEAGNGFWGDVDCRAPRVGICSRELRAEPPAAQYESRPESPAVNLARAASCPAGFRRVPVRRLGERGGRSVCLSELQEARDLSAAERHCQQLDPVAAVWRPGRASDPRRWKDVPGVEGDAVVWAGADRRGPRGHWRWQADGAAVPAAAWAAGQPEERAGDCAAFSAADRGLVVSECAVERPFLCERPPEGCQVGWRVTESGGACRREDEYGPDGGEGCEEPLCRAVCPAGTSAVGRACWALQDERRTHDDAQRFCQSKGMTLLSVEGQEEKELARRIAQTIRSPVWIADGGPDGAVSNYTNYHEYVAYGLPAEPNEGGDGPPSCLLVWYDGEWMDVDCRLEFAVICSLQITEQDCDEAAEQYRAGL